MTCDGNWIAATSKQLHDAEEKKYIDTHNRALPLGTAQALRTESIGLIPICIDSLGGMGPAMTHFLTGTGKEQAKNHELNSKFWEKVDNVIVPLHFQTGLDNQLRAAAKLQHSKRFVEDENDEMHPKEIAKYWAPNAKLMIPQYLSTVFQASVSNFYRLMNQNIKSSKWDKHKRSVDHLSDTKYNNMFINKHTTTSASDTDWEEKSLEENNKQLILNEISNNNDGQLLNDGEEENHINKSGDKEIYVVNECNTYNEELEGTYINDNNNNKNYDVSYVNNSRTMEIVSSEANTSPLTNQTGYDDPIPEHSYNCECSSNQQQFHILKRRILTSDTENMDDTRRTVRSLYDNITSNTTEVWSDGLMATITNRDLTCKNCKINNNNNMKFQRLFWQKFTTNKNKDEIDGDGAQQLTNGNLKNDNGR